MLAPPRPAAVPSAARLRRGARRGTILGLGLLVAGGAAAPAALAEEPTDPDTLDATPDVPVSAARVLVATPAPSQAVSGPLIPSFGTGKAFDLALIVDGATPDDLDLSGAQFAFTKAGSPTPAATCTTTSSGTCTVGYGRSGIAPTSAGSTVTLANGVYTITQVASVDGLTPVSGPFGQLTMDYDSYYDGVRFGQPIRKPAKISNVSEYTPRVTASVVDAETGDVLAGAGFALSGAADYPARSAAEAAVDRVEPAVPTSDEDGVVTFDGWFLPGELTLTPVGIPDGYVLGAAMTLTVPSTPGFHAPEAWALADSVEVARVAPPQVEQPPVVPGPTGTPTQPNTTPTSNPASTPAGSAAPARPVTPSAAASVSSAAPVPTSAPTSSSATRAPQALVDRVPGTAADVAPLTGGTDLETVSSTVPAWSVAAIGLLFVAAVVGGVMVMRRRVRR
jgi:hypothetical protein